LVRVAIAVCAPSGDIEACKADDLDDVVASRVVERPDRNEVDLDHPRVVVRIARSGVRIVGLARDPVVGVVTGRIGTTGVVDVVAIACTGGDAVRHLSGALAGLRGNAVPGARVPGLRIEEERATAWAGLPGRRGRAGRLVDGAVEVVDPVDRLAT